MNLLAFLAALWLITYIFRLRQHPSDSRSILWIPCDFTSTLPISSQMKFLSVQIQQIRPWYNKLLAGRELMVLLYVIGSSFIRTRFFMLESRGEFQNKCTFEQLATRSMSARNATIIMTSPRDELTLSQCNHPNVIFLSVFEDCCCLTRKIRQRTCKFMQSK
jgi:hypothetical protein